MKLLQEFLVLNEQNDKNIDGWMVSLEDSDAVVTTISSMISPESMEAPADYSEPQDVALNIESMSAIIENKTERYVLNYGFNPKTNYINDGRLLTKDFVNDLKSLTPVLYNSEDDQINDFKVMTSTKSILARYAEQFDLLQEIRNNASEKQGNPDDWYQDDHFDDREGEFGDHPDW